MENASKALIMAAEILLGIILITIAVLGYTSWSEFSKNIHTNIENRNIQQFNTKFLQYSGKKDLTAHDVVSIIKLAEEYNYDSEGKYIEDANFKIEVKLNIGSGMTISKILDNIPDFLTNNLKSKYSIAVTINEKTNIVKQVLIKKEN